MNKRGQELSTSTIILIILGVIILVVLVIGFTIGWNKIIPYVSSSNTDTVSTQCLSACSTSSVYDFCSRTFAFNTGTITINNATCNYLAQQQSQYGITGCSSVTCSMIFDTATSVSNLQSQCNSSVSGKIVQALISGTVQSVNCP